MCGRFAFYSPHESVTRLFPVEDVPPLQPRYNLAPTQFVASVRQLKDEPPKIALLRWGLIPFWAKDKAIGNRMINARAETVHEKPAYRAAFRKRRCLILADGFYEWHREGELKIPHFIHRRDGDPFAMAGLWESWNDGVSDKPLDSCTIVTTDANSFMTDLHNRMPVILQARNYADWLDPGNSDLEGLRELLIPLAGEVLAEHAVSREVNNPRNDDASLIEAA